MNDLDLEDLLGQLRTITQSYQPVSVAKNEGDSLFGVLESDQALWQELQEKLSMERFRKMSANLQ